VAEAEAIAEQRPKEAGTIPAATQAPSAWTARRLFFIALATYMIFFGGHYVSGDNAQRIAWAKALLYHGSNDLSASFPGLHYTKYGIGASLLHMPFLLAADGIKRLTGISCEGPIGMVLYELNAALGLTLIFSILVARSGIKPADAFVRSLVIGFCTIWFPYSKIDYSETLAAVALLAVFRFAEDRPWIAGLCGSMAIMLRSESILWLWITVLFATLEWKALVRIAIGSTPGLIITFWANFARSGNILSSGYEVDFSTPLLIGIYGLLFSAGKGALFFSPLLFLFPWAVADLSHSRNGRRLAGWAITMAAAQLCFYGRWWDWSGEDSWGPRLITYAMLTALITIAASGVSRTRFFIAAAIAGLCLQLPPVLIGPHTSIMIDRTRAVSVPGPARAPFMLSLDDMHFIPAYSQITNTANLLLLKIAPDAAALDQTAWMRGIDPPVDIHKIPIDLFLINRPHSHR
jgi:hypothetical protein